MNNNSWFVSSRWFLNLWAIEDLIKHFGVVLLLKWLEWDVVILPPLERKLAEVIPQLGSHRAQGWFRWPPLRRIHYLRFRNVHVVRVQIVRHKLRSWLLVIIERAHHLPLVLRLVLLHLGQEKDPSVLIWSPRLQILVLVEDPLLRILAVKILACLVEGRSLQNLFYSPGSVPLVRCIRLL